MQYLFTIFFTMHILWSFHASLPLCHSDHANAITAQITAETSCDCPTISSVLPNELITHTSLYPQQLIPEILIYSTWAWSDATHWWAQSGSATWGCKNETASSVHKQCSQGGTASWCESIMKLKQMKFLKFQQLKVKRFIYLIYTTTYEFTSLSWNSF